ncbi:kinase-like domain-containing protein [Rhizophagus clarus]|uniref:Kinase-like domain-containing protein n=1 Tax=Rhizophagus clarus TaxID=94130 RepID=A0A8H3R3P2_9GLOM|nr:kinase-like domain-containing protein [Rhizophagus clarus]
MSNDTENTIIKDTDYYSELLERSIAEERIIHYKYSDFKNVQQIEGNVFRATWKCTDLFFALKSFNNNQKSVQKVVNEINLHKKVDLHPNILKFYGIIKIEADVIHQMDSYFLVLEYADSGTLESYLSNHFDELDWKDKYRLAFQLASVVECLHECDIIHRDLNADNILVHQKNIKLADFGLSKNIDEESSNSSTFFAYIDPKFLSKEQNQNYELNEKSDVYSIGVLLWQISSGRQPFNIESDDLAHDIIAGKREEIIDGTPIEYSNLYRECWKLEPNERPDMHKIVSTLREIISHEQKDDNLLEIYNLNSSSNEEIIDINHDLILDDISSMNLSYADDSKSNSSSQDQTTVKSSIIGPETHLFDVNINNVIIDKVIKKHNKGFTFEQIKQLIIQQISQLNQSSGNIINWLKNNQDKSEYVWFLGLFYYYNIDYNNDTEEAFELFSKAASNDCSIAQVYLAKCYNDGRGVKQNKNKSFYWYQKAAENKSIVGQVYLGYCYEHGIGIKQNEKKSIYYYKKAADSGNMTAMLYLANCYRLGNGVEKDEIKAFKYYEFLASQKVSDAQYQLGNCYHNGVGTNKNKIQAKFWYERAASDGNIVAKDILKKHYNKQANENMLQMISFKKMKQFGLNYYGTILTKKHNTKGVHYIQKAAESGYKIAQYKLGNVYKEGEDTEKDERKAFEYYKKSAEQGHVNAKFQLGYCYDKGIGTDINKIKAFELYEAAKEKNSDAQNYLGSLYENGQGIEKNPKEAFQCYKKAAEKKNKIAQYNLGRSYELGIGIKRDDKQAFNIYKELANEGYLDAIFKLGNCYNKGIGTDINKRTALELYEKAAMKDNTEAQICLGTLYENGQGIDKDPKKAFEWYKKAAEHDNEVAYYNLGRCYEFGIGTERDDSKAFDFYKNSAESNHLDALFQLGYLYYNGKGVKTDKEKALILYKQAAEKGHAIAQYYLGENSEKIEKNLKLASHWYQKSAENGYEVAQYTLGTYYESGKGVTKDKVKAFELYEKAAKKEFIEAQYKLGECYYDGIGTKVNKEKAFDLYKKLSEKGNNEAQYKLGQLYEKGEGTEENLELSFYWYQKSAENGYEVAQYTIGAYYEFGKGVNMDKSKAFELYEKAAKKEFTEAQYKLGECYYDGIGTKVNKEKAFNLYKKVSEKGNNEAQYKLGQLYEQGEGTEKDSELAFYWYQKSAKNGYEDAQYNLGKHYELGEGINKDESKAFKLYEKAAKRGLIKAQYKLGNCYYRGIGTEINKKKAFELYENAAKEGHTEAQNALGSLYENGEGTEKDLGLSLYWYQQSEDKEFNEKFKIVNSKQLNIIKQLNNNSISYAIVSTDDREIETAVKNLQIIGKDNRLSLLRKMNEWYPIYNHHKIVEFLGISIKDENQLFLIMPFANGDNLRKYMDKNTLSFNKKIEIAKDITEGIKFLHKNGIIHENLNPKNILIFDGVAKISNLPLSYNNDDKDDLYINDSLFDNIGYIDPNLFLNKNSKKRDTIDIYSLGSLLWEIMSERIPYSSDQNENILQLIIKIKEGYRESDILDISAEYVALYKECWDGESSVRPSINEVYIRLSNIR